MNILLHVKSGVQRVEVPGSSRGLQHNQCKILAKFGFFFYAFFLQFFSYW